MKLSAAIEQAIVTGVYSLQSPYMCHAMEGIGQHHLVPFVQALVYSINPIENLPSQPLICALMDSPECTFDFDSGPDRKSLFAYSKECYCWWVFDLKRKGL